MRILKIFAKHFTNFKFWEIFRPLFQEFEELSYKFRNFSSNLAKFEEIYDILKMGVLGGVKRGVGPLMGLGHVAWELNTTGFLVCLYFFLLLPNFVKIYAFAKLFTLQISKMFW